VTSFPLSNNASVFSTSPLDPFRDINLKLRGETVQMKIKA